MKRTKIIATLGPSSGSAAKIEKLIRAGVNVFRLNFSHGDHATHREAYRTIRRIEKKTGAHIAVLQDLQGPKIRVGLLEGGSTELKARQRVTLTTRAVTGSSGVIPVTYAALPRDVRPGGRILLDDGRLEMKVISASGRDVECSIIRGGTLKDHKGINLPGANISSPGLTPKDVEDLEFGLTLGIDFVALSFVRTGACVDLLKSKLGKRANAVRIIAKIERPEAVRNIVEIIDRVDGVMIARGDLGVEMSPEKVPGIQKRIIEMANDRGRIAITATQMLESMMDAPRPTRAEASDVANAVLDGTDAVMLSGETAAGKYPVESVEMMSRIIAETERRMTEREHSLARRSDATGFTAAVARAASRAAYDTGAKAIVAFTRTGNAALQISRYRPPHIIVGATPDERIARRMALTWGVLPVLFDRVNSLDALSARVDEKLISSRIAKKGNVVIITFGIPVGRAGTTDLIKIHRIGKKD